MRTVWMCALAAAAAMLMGSFHDCHQTVIECPPAIQIAEPPETLVGPIQLKAAEPLHSELAHPHPHGDQVCASGCTLSRHPTATLTQARFEQLIATLTSQPTNTAAIDEMLYFGTQARTKLNRITDELPATVRSMLLDELRSDRAAVMIRLVSESGDVLADLPSQIVRLDVRHEYDLQEHSIPELVASGTVKRVGRDRLWSRL